MYQIKSLQDTIAAISTPPGNGGIGIIRISGRESIAIADRMFVSKSGMLPSQFVSFKMHYGLVVKKMMKSPGSLEGAFKAADEEIVDQALLTVFRAPKSYTAEDVVEISCHGGAVSVKAILSLALGHGARLAEPGEFTKRAFINGRIDLAQAEAVIDVITAKTEAFLRVSTYQLQGQLSSQLEIMRQELMEIYLQMEAVLNFPEDDLDAATRQQLIDRLKTQHGRIDQLLKSSLNGRILKEGMRVVLCGKPNVGKSSLLNALLKQSRAIVTEIAGTTRDAIEETVQIQGVPIQLVDTAGILEPRDLIEVEAIKRSHQSIGSADLAVLVLDASQSLSRDDELLFEKLKNVSHLIVFNKCDLPLMLDENLIKKVLDQEKVVKISAIDGVGVEDLEKAIIDRVWHQSDRDAHEVVVCNTRHISALNEALEAIFTASQVMSQGESMELASEDIKQAINQLDAITGRNIDADLLDRIFEKFCIGK